MKMNPLVIVVGLAAVGGAAFFFWSRRQGNYMIAAGPTAQGTPLNPNVLNQPSQVYPFTPAPTTRQDTASQPWYGGARPQDATASLMDPNLLANVQTVNALNSGAKSLTELWGNLGVSNWFSDPEPVAGDDIFAGLDWNSFNA